MEEGSGNGRGAGGWELAGPLPAAGARGVCNKHNCFGQAGLSRPVMCSGLVHQNRTNPSSSPSTACFTYGNDAIGEDFSFTS